MTAARARYLAEIGIPVWRLRTAAPVPEASPGGSVEAPTVPPGGAAVDDVWSDLEAKVRVCTLCALHRGRTQTVFGVGKRDAELFVIGEAPGADEDRQGEPFVGRAGQLLNAMLRAIGLPRSEVYIANILKCRPPGNRDPQPEESGVMYAVSCAANRARTAQGSARRGAHRGSVAVADGCADRSVARPCYYLRRAQYAAGSHVSPGVSSS